MTIADTGPGLDAAELDLIFMPFERLGAAESAIEGTGLEDVIARSNGPRLLAEEQAHVVLYVEDNHANFALAEEILARRGDVELVRAESGTRAIELARERTPDVVLLDLDLPDIPGHEVLARLQSDPVTRELPVVILSADATQSQVQRLLGVGAREYLTKPIDVSQFLAVVDAQLAEPSAGGTVQQAK